MTDQISEADLQLIREEIEAMYKASDHEADKFAIALKSYTPEKFARAKIRRDRAQSTTHKEIEDE